MAAPRKPAAPARVDVDFDADLGELDLSPVAARIGGKVWKIRRDMSVDEVRTFWQTAAAKDDAGCLGMILGSPAQGQALDKLLTSMPHVKQKRYLRSVMTAAGIIDQDGNPQGEA
jgi:hypothetical protein